MFFYLFLLNVSYAIDALPFNALALFTMLKDIKNVMGTKRPNSDLHGSILDLRNGITHEVKPGEKFFIGRAISSTICIEELYISRRHSIINYENGEFVIYDNESSSGTYLNYSKLSNNKATLVDGDIISYTNLANTWQFVYLFKTSSNSKKKSKVDKESTAVENNILNEKYKESMKDLQAQVLELKIDIVVLYDKSMTQITELKNMFNVVLDFGSKLKSEIITLKAKNQELCKKLNVFRKQLQKDDERIDIFKTQISKHLDTDLQCPICNEVMIRSNMTSCNHFFCESCIKQWLNKSKVCPVCRGIVQSISYCLAFDSYLTNLYDILGGTIKEQRVNLQNERIVDTQPAQTARRGRRRGQPNLRRRPNLTNDLPFENIRNFPPPVIEVVDLTHSISL